jgi:uncharacterized protein (UPF0264 family)
MTWHVDYLGPLSALAAAYLAEAQEWSGDLLASECPRRLAENDVLAASVGISRARRERRPLTAAEQELVESAQAHVRRGVQLPAGYATVGRSGQRRHQTMISLANSGEGHLAVTLKDSDLLDGVIVHHEVIARTGRDGLPDPDLAPYRMIDIRQNGVIRLHAAADVPVTVYAGRPNLAAIAPDAAVTPRLSVREAYDLDPVTPSHTAAAAASAAFANGVADVKFCLDGLTASQAVDFMKRVADAADRAPGQQLSTQFNVLRPLLDDWDPAGGAHGRRAVSDPAAIAHLALELTRAGGWDRVTLDSASRVPRSLPLLDVIGFPALAEWVSEAHALGVETYISGGMSDEHVRLAAYAGVDGVGIGFRVHRYNTATGAPEQLDGDAIRRTIAARNEAERSPRGMAAALLARLQASIGQGSGTGRANPATAPWLTAILNGDEAAVHALIVSAGSAFA